MPVLPGYSDLLESSRGTAAPSRAHADFRKGCADQEYAIALIHAGVGHQIRRHSNSPETDISFDGTPINEQLVRDLADGAFLDSPGSAWRGESVIPRAHALSRAHCARANKSVDPQN